MKLMKVTAALLASMALFACGGKSANEYRIWTQEGETDGALQFVTLLADEFGEMQDPKIKIVVENRDTEVLREDFITASKAGGAPDMVWTVNDHVGPFVAADIIIPADDIPGIDVNAFDESALRAVKMNDASGNVRVWGVPVSNGNHLMLLYNKEKVANPPQNTDEMIAIARQNTSGDNYGLVFNQKEPFWLVPWLGGFGGKVFAEDGITPNLDTPEMVATLQFLYDLKFQHGIIPPESDYNSMDTLFKEGKAAMIVNGDWSLADYQGALGDKLGIARLPKVSSTGLWPAPYTSGKFILFSKASAADPVRMDIMTKFAQYATALENQARMVQYLTRLPSTKEALSQEKLVDDEVQNAILKASADQLAVGTPMPTVAEMRYCWDNMRPKMAEVLANKTSPADAAKQMQELTLAQIQAISASAAQ